MIRLSATTDFGLQLACWNSQPLAAVQVADVALAVRKLMAAAVLMDAAACRWWPLLLRIVFLLRILTIHIYCIAASLKSHYKKEAVFFLLQIFVCPSRFLIVANGLASSRAAAGGDDVSQIGSF